MLERNTIILYINSCIHLKQCLAMEKPSISILDLQKKSEKVQSGQTYRYVKNNKITVNNKLYLKAVYISLQCIPYIYLFFF